VIELPNESAETVAYYLFSIYNLALPTHAQDENPFEDLVSLTNASYRLLAELNILGTRAWETVAFELRS
jgi:hypothetical protein